MLDEKDWVRLREVLVTREECRDQIDQQDKKFANDDKRLAVIETYQKVTLAVMSAVGVGVVSIVLNLFSGGIS